MDVSRTSFKIADIVFAVEAVSGIPLSMDQVWQQFVCEEAPDIVIEIPDSPCARIAPGTRKSFSSLRICGAMLVGNDQISLVCIILILLLPSND